MCEVMSDGPTVCLGDDDSKAMGFITTVNFLSLKVQIKGDFRHNSRLIR